MSLVSPRLFIRMTRRIFEKPFGFHRLLKFDKDRFQTGETLWTSPRDSTSFYLRWYLVPLDLVFAVLSGPDRCYEFCSMKGYDFLDRILVYRPLDGDYVTNWLNRKRYWSELNNKYGNVCFDMNRLATTNN